MHLSEWCTRIHTSEKFVRALQVCGQSTRKGIPKGVNSGHLISKQLYIMHQITPCVGNYPLQKKGCYTYIRNYSFSGIVIPKH